jgi:CHAT domain-containing protein
VLLRHQAMLIGPVRVALGRAWAKTLVMSLWKVPDLASAVLIAHFYHNLLRGHGRHESLHEAQRYTRGVTMG